MQQTSSDETKGAWMTAGEIATEFGVHRNTIRNWADAGHIPVTILPSGIRRYRRTDVEELLKAAS